jgi:hypothetical protein
MSMKVDCRGVVHAIEAHVTGTLDETLPCVFDAARNARFAAPQRGFSTVRVPLSFVNTEPPGRLEP